MFIRNLTLTALLIFSITVCQSQTVKVKKETARIKSENTEGFEVELQGTDEEVQNALSKYMKTFGKTKQSDNMLTVNEPMVLGKKYVYPMYAMTKVQASATSAWIGIRKNEWLTDAETVGNEIEKMAYEFGVTFYRDKIQKQIDESTRAFQAVERQQQRLVNQNRDHNNRLEDNKREKLQLERSLELNKLEFETLLKKLDQNKKDQDSVALAAEQIKKVIEMQKEKQRKVN